MAAAARSGARALRALGVSQRGRTGGGLGGSRPPRALVAVTLPQPDLGAGECGRAPEGKKRGVGGGPGARAPGRWRAEPGRPCPARTHGSAVEFAQFPSLLFLLPSLSPPLTPPPLGYSLLSPDATSRNPFFCCFGASFSLAAQRDCECWTRRRAGGSARRPPAGARGAERRTDGKPAGRTICSPQRTPQTPVECVRARQGWGSVRPARRDRVPRGLPLDEVRGLRSGSASGSETAEEIGKQKRPLS